ncbi:MAG: tetratricopeptide repeat protein [Chitinophagales bacterium]
MRNKTVLIRIIVIAFVSLLAINTTFAKKKKKDKNGTTSTITKEDLETQALFIEAMQAYLLGNNQEAVTKFNTVIKRDKNNDASYYELSKIAYEAGNMDKAIEYANAAIKINPDNEYYYQYLAEAKAEKNDFEGAAKTYEALVKLKPKEYDYYYDWAYMLSRANKFKEAIDVYNLVEQKTSVSEELIFQKQPLFIKLGKIDDAIKDVEKLVKLYPEETKYQALVGEIYEANKQFDKAIGVYNKILDKDPNNADALLALAEAYRKKGDEAKHTEYINQVFGNKNIDIDSKILTFIPYIEKLAKDTTMRDEVLKMADLIKATHPNNMKATTAKADVLYTIGKKKDAQTEYVKATQLGDVPSTVWIQLYILDLEIEDYDSLISHTKRGIAQNPKDPFGYFYNALAHQNKKEYKETSDILLDGFDKQRKKDADLSLYTPQLKLQMLIALGDVSFELKNYERSDSAYEAALEIDPNNATVLNNYAYYLSERDNKLEKAEKMSKKSNLLVDNNSAFIDTYAWIMYKMKNYSEALEWMEQAMQLPDARERPELLQHYGDILFKTGKVEDAVAQWKRALEKGGDKAILESRIKNKKIE